MTHLFCYCRFVTLNFPYLSHSSSDSPPQQLPVCSLCLCVVGFKNFTYKWNHTVFVFFVRLTSLSIVSSRSSYFVTNARFHSFLFLRNIPVFWGCVHIPHIFCIHSHTGGHLGCFDNLAIINNAAMNKGVNISFWIWISAFVFF